MVEVRLIAQTQIDEYAMRDIGYEVHGDVLDGDFIYSVEQDADELAEMAGRLCYLSWHRPNPATATNAGYTRNIINQRHESVLAHASFTFYVVASRACTHEMIRSRFLAFSEVSQRYVDPKRIVEQVGTGDEYEQQIISYEKMFRQLRDIGFNLKEARGIARKELPLGFPTAMIASGNVRAWRDFIRQRNTDHADSEIREVAMQVLNLLREHAPNSVQDM